MDDFPNVLCEWSWEENKSFELALAVVDERDPDRWKVVAAMVGGKSAEEVEKHYVILLQDLQFIESGEMDHKLGEAQPCVQLECWTDQDHKYAISLPIIGRDFQFCCTICLIGCFMHLGLSPIHLFRIQIWKIYGCGHPFIFLSFPPVLSNQTQHQGIVTSLGF
ncbi:Transcription factor RADIALIS [Vitis vinifera]|uniref:Transcription factor RADIALIS n=1 Tax=Vitis vinifera TaxID=29760 RepID=A0A438BNG6_VITVI|nr:Transcription factor RADIALIS [Vitis vinifera]